jgi:hypothetical protein
MACRGPACVLTEEQVQLEKMISSDFPAVEIFLEIKAI